MYLRRIPRQTQFHEHIAKRIMFHVTHSIDLPTLYKLAVDEEVTVKQELTAVEKYIYEQTLHLTLASSSAHPPKPIHSTHLGLQSSHFLFPHFMQLYIEVFSFFPQVWTQHTQYRALAKSTPGTTELSRATR